MRVVEVRWYVRSDFDAGQTAAAWTRLARHHLPEALPRRYGTYEPLSKKLDNGGVEAFTDFVRDADGTVYFKGSQPVEDGHLDAGPQRGNAAGHSLTLLFPALEDPRWRGALRGLFIDFALATEAVAGTAEVVRGVRWSGRSLGYDGNTERTAYLAWGRRWAGLPPYPVWWSWFGAEYAPLVAPHLPSHQVEAHVAGVFHTRSDAPADRDELTALRAQRPGGTLRRLFRQSAAAAPPWLPPELLMADGSDDPRVHTAPRPAAWRPASLS